MAKSKYSVSRLVLGAALALAGFLTAPEAALAKASRELSRPKSSFVDPVLVRAKYDPKVSQVKVVVDGKRRVKIATVRDRKEAEKKIAVVDRQVLKALKKKVLIELRPADRGTHLVLVSKKPLDSRKTERADRIRMLEKKLAKRDTALQGGKKKSDRMPAQAMGSKKSKARKAAPLPKPEVFNALEGDEVSYLELPVERQFESF